MDRQAQIAVAGCVCLDMIPDWPAGVSLGKLEPGKLLEIGPARLSTGGAVSNTGQALHRLGVPVELVGKVGDDAIGQMILDLLRRQDPHLADAMIVAAGQASSYTVVISPPGSDRLFLHHPGANNTFVADDIDYAWPAQPHARLFHFGYPPIMRRMFADGGEQCEVMLGRVGEFGVTTSLDMARVDPASPAGAVDWPSLLARVLPHVDLYLPSLDETLFMLDRPLLERLEPGAGDHLAAAVGIDRISRLAEQLLALGAAVVGFKLGADGLYLRTTADRDRLAAAGKAFTPATGRVDGAMARWLDRQLLAPCFAVEVAGTTGAGDCTIAGLLASVLAGCGPAEAAVAAVAVGACSVEQADATSGVLPWPIVAGRIQSGWQRRPTRVALPGWRWDQSAEVWTM